MNSTIIYKILFTTIIVVSLLALSIGCGSKEKSQTSQLAEKPYDSIVIEYMGVDSASVYDLLIQKYVVRSTQSSLGAFVKEIDSVKSNLSYTWLYSVNDSMGQIASDQYITTSSDKVRWHYRKVD